MATEPALSVFVAYTGIVKPFIYMGAFAECLIYVTMALSLIRLRMTCCAADTIPLKVRIITPYALSGFNDLEWVSVKGQIQFISAPGSNRYIPVIKVAENTDVSKLKDQSKNDYE